MIVMFLIVCCIIGMSLLSTPKAMSWQDRNNFLGDFITSEDRPAAIVSFVNETMSKKLHAAHHFGLDLENSSLHSADILRRFANKVYLHKSWYNISRLAIQRPKTLRRRVLVDDNVIYISNLTEDTVWSLIEAQKLRILKTPSRWLLFYSFKKPVPINYQNFTTEVDLSEPAQTEILDLDKEKREIGSLLEDVYVSLDSEVYVVIEHQYELRIFLVHRLRPHLPLIWDEYGRWDQTTGLYKIAHRETVPMRRKNINRLDIYAAAFFELNNTMDHLRDYLHRHIDTPAKISYYMTMHLFDWLNATGHINMTDSYGYLQKDGTYNGASRELIEERSEFSATVMLFSRQRMEVVEYMLSPCRGDVKFMFRKPSLASVANIYALPFSRGVWLSVLVLIAVLTSLLFLASGWEQTIIDAKIATTTSQRLSQCLHDTLCLALQQGTAVDPIVLSGRQVLFIGLMSFMFLYTAYSAFVVALLQSATNDINSVEAILNSPLQILAQQRPYSKLVFQYDNRPAHRALWLKKGAPQGENFFVTVEEGIRKIREGLFAFHVEETSGYDFIQKTFLEHEKCNLGTVKFMADNYPSTLIAKESFVKEPLRVGTLRVFESGLQSRSCRRAVPKPPQCAATTAMFTPVTLQVALPVFKYFFIVCASTVVILGLELYVHRYEQKRKSKGTAVDVVVSPDSELE